MQQDFAELTVFAVENVHGQLTSCVYGALVYNGRQRAAEIIKETGLSPRQVTSTLVVLVQTHLVYHHTEDSGQVYYSANADVAYNLAFRVGKMAEVIENRLGKNAAEVFLTVSERGHATVKDMIAMPRSDGENNDISPSSEHLIRKSLDELLRLGFLCKVTEIQYMPEWDLHNEAVHQLLQDEPEPKTTDGRRAFQDRVIHLKRKWRDEADEYSDLPIAVPRRNPNRGRWIPNSTINGQDSIANGDDPDQTELPDDLAMRPHFERFSVILRNQQLVKLAHRYIGETTSKVYDALLRSIELHLPRCYDPLTKPEELDSENEPPTQRGQRIPPKTILKYLEPGLNLQSGLLSAPIRNGVNGTHTNSRIQTHHSDLESSEPESDTDTFRLRQLTSHLRLLQRDSHAFVEQSPSGHYTVPFRRLTRTLTQHVIESHTRSTHGLVAFRILRILHRNLSMDEKMLASHAVLKAKDLRSPLDALLRAGIVDTQEIPRDHARSTNRLLWLYAYSPSKARRRILTDAYRAMARLLRRADVVKREKFGAVIDKSERSDVVGNEEKFLSVAEHDALKRWGKVEELTLGTLGRLDDLVACLRDFSPLDDPWVGNRERPVGWTAPGAGK